MLSVEVTVRLAKGILSLFEDLRVRGVDPGPADHVSHRSGPGGRGSGYRQAQRLSRALRELYRVHYLGGGDLGEPAGPAAVDPRHYI